VVGVRDLVENRGDAVFLLRVGPDPGLARCRTGANVARAATSTRLEVA
jgi:hypothetical protein